MAAPKAAALPLGDTPIFENLHHYKLKTGIYQGLFWLFNRTETH
jgi:hypothetical protein